MCSAWDPDEIKLRFDRIWNVVTRTYFSDEQKRPNLGKELEDFAVRLERNTGTMIVGAAGSGKTLIATELRKDGFNDGIALASEMYDALIPSAWTSLGCDRPYEIALQLALHMKPTWDSKKVERYFNNIWDCLTGSYVPVALPDTKGAFRRGTLLPLAEVCYGNPR